jgi:two-component system cell cycle sensor histidine kinase/response regulator CckA
MSDSKTILLVEDEELFRGMLGDLLRFDDYNVLEAASGDEALGVASSHAGGIDLVVTDINLNGMNGLELTHELIKQHPRMGIIYMSGDTLSGAVGDEKIPDGAQFLPKPFESTALLDKVRQTLQS